MDPWCDKKPGVQVAKEFEDNFAPVGVETSTERLSDSAQYLALLERRLKSVRAKNNIVENLTAYRADCIERLMRDGCTLDPVIGDTDQEKLISKEL